MKSKVMLLCSLTAISYSMVDSGFNIYVMLFHMLICTAGLNKRLNVLNENGSHESVFTYC